MTSLHPDNRLGRRRLLQAFGAGAVGAAALGPKALLDPAEARPARTPCAAPSTTTFGRIFALPPFARPSAALTEALLHIGRPGGILDARDDLAAGPQALIVDPALSVHNRNNPTHTAGTTFFGQFLDHDLTFDASSTLGRPTRPELTRNARTPAFDLDSLYGAGPVADQLLYRKGDRAKLKIGFGGQFEDLPRDADGQALVGDPRNDENLFVAGLHCAFILFHNAVVDRVRTLHGPEDALRTFATARRLVTWHYHWLIVNEFLPKLVGRRLVRHVLANGGRWFAPARGHGFMPVEFQGAAYRCGHSMVRPSYRANLAGDAGQPFFGFVFDPSQDGAADPSDLRGGARAPRRFVGWQTFFDFGDGQVKPNKRIDTRISTPLFHLPLGAIASHNGPTALPQRNLLRQVTWSLPSGQALAAHMGLEPLARADLAELHHYGLRLDRSTPLWYYVLKEAEVMQDGLRLGPVGARIVAEVMVGLLRADPGSYLAVRPAWRPTLGTSGHFHTTDLLRIAGVSPAARGQ
jgi:Animal haem peroxidase